VPRTPIEVIPAAFTALKAYSETRPRPKKTHRTKQSGGSSRKREIEQAHRQTEMGKRITNTYPLGTTDPLARRW